ncbi:DUF2492 family protein [Flexithrix dorotheae]|uniref:DUF2492 family protein n=1 Tax=Flexithrix dorotheae TaxID=70993 RepID=UPI00036F03D6|nr:DUF2492 family protein [Flexithrix dorotheae]
MANTYHIHDTLDFITEEQGKLTKANFEEQLASKFGIDVMFSSCTIPYIRINEVISFLEMKGKIQYSPDGKIIMAGVSCEH